MEIKLDFHPEQFVESLTYLVAGMVSIFVVIGVIIVVTVALNKLFSRDKKKGE